MGVDVHGPMADAGVCVCGWRSTASSPSRAEANLRRHIQASSQTSLIAALPASSSLPIRFVDALFRTQTVAWILLRGAVLDLLVAILITAPARHAVPGPLFAASAIAMVMIASRVLTAILLSAEWNVTQPPRRIVGPPIYSGLFGPDRDIWSRAIAAADVMSYAGPRPYQPILEEYARLSVRKLFPAWVREQYEAWRDKGEEEPAVLRGREIDEIVRTDVIGYYDPASGESVGHLMRDPLRFERARLMGLQVRSFVSLAREFSELAFVVLLAVAVPAIEGGLDYVTALQIALAAVFVIALLLQAYLYVCSSNLWFVVGENLQVDLRPPEREFLQQLKGRRLPVRWRFQPGFDRLLRRTMSSRLVWPLLFNTVWILVLMCVPVSLSLLWPGGPHRAESYAYLALAVMAIPLALLLGLHYILGAIQNHRLVMIPVVSGVAAALLAGILTLLATGESAELQDAVQGAWVGLPTALAAAIVAAVQRPTAR
jgi:hypothetical protein